MNQASPRYPITDSGNRTFLLNLIVFSLLACLPGAVLGDTPVQNEMQKLLASDGAEGDIFGAQALAIDADTLVVSAVQDDEGTDDSGSVYVYSRDGSGNWTEAAKLTASDNADPNPGFVGNLFGFGSDINGDTIVVGAPIANSVQFDDTGAAYVFTRNGQDVWSEQVKLTASDRAANDFFGRDIALDSDTLAIGANRNDDDGDDSGSVYIFTRNGMGVWTEYQKLTASDAAAGDNFGFSLGLDGDYLIVGAQTVDDGADNAGAAYVFKRAGNGDWSEQQKLTASDRAAGDLFGWRVDVDGDTAVINANDDDDNGSDSGSIYVFERNGAGVWNEVDKILASDGEADDGFGFPLDIEGDLLLAGATGDDDAGDRAGAAYLFERDGVGFWHERRKFLPSDGAATDSFGDALGLHGNTAVVGAVGDDDEGDDAGSAYVFKFDLAGADIDFSGPLKIVFEDLGGAIYSGTPVDTEFTGAISDSNFNGFITDGTTNTPFSCCIAAGGLSVTNNDQLNAEDAALINSVAGTNLQAGDFIDGIDIEGDEFTAGGGRIEVGLSYILDPNAFDNENNNNYPPDPNDVLAILFFIVEEDNADEEIYNAIGLVERNLDADGDGIADAIDGTYVASFNDESQQYSNAFTDQHLGGTTLGSIVVRNDNEVMVTDDLQSGVTLSASGGAGFSLVQLCGPSNVDIFFVLLSDGDQVDVACGSLSAQVLSGPVHVQAGTDIEVKLPTGAETFMDLLPGSILSIQNLSAMNGPNIQVTANGVKTSIGPGDPAFTATLDLAPVRLLDAGRVNGNNKTDLAVLLREPGTDRNIVHIKDGGSGNTISAVAYGKDPVRGFATVPDATADMVTEYGVLVEGSLIARVKDPVGGTVIGKPKFNPNYEPLATFSVGDIGGGAGPDLAVVGRDPGTGKVQAQIKDTMSGAPVKTISFSKSYVPFGAVLLDNVGDSTAVDIAVLGINAAGEVRAQVKDALSGNQVNLVYFNENFTPLAFAAVPNPGGKLKHFAILGRNAAGAIKAEVRSASTGALVKKVSFNKNYEPRAFLGFVDSNNSGSGEIAVVGINNAGKVRAQVKEIANGAAVSTVSLSAGYPPIDAIAINGVAGTGRNEIAVLGQHANGSYQLFIRDLLDGDLVIKMPVP